jgi:hypothetical protein
MIRLKSAKAKCHSRDQKSFCFTGSPAPPCGRLLNERIVPELAMAGDSESGGKAEEIDW